MITRVTTKSKEFFKRNGEASLTIVNHTILLLISISLYTVIFWHTPEVLHLLEEVEDNTIDIDGEEPFV